MMNGADTNRNKKSAQAALIQSARILLLLNRSMYLLYIVVFVGPESGFVLVLLLLVDRHQQVV